MTMSSSGIPDDVRIPCPANDATLSRMDRPRQVSAAMDAARQMGPFVDTGNENGNGNALALIWRRSDGHGR